MRREADLLTVLRRCSDEPHALLLMARLSPVMGDHVRWLADHVRGAERLEAYEWTPPDCLPGGSRWYIEVADPSVPVKQPYDAPIRARIWFTVFISSPEIIWNSSPGRGNCGTRDRRWHGLFHRRWPHLVAGTDYHKYTFRP